MCIIVIVSALVVGLTIGADVQPNCEFVGPNVGRLKNVENVDLCAKACTDTEECTRFNYNNDQRLCTLHSGVGDAIPSNDKPMYCGKTTKDDFSGDVPAVRTKKDANCDECGINNSNSYGCQGGYCWASCTTYVGIVFPEWCYTNGNTNIWDSVLITHGNYKTCSRNEDCCPCWRCAGFCAAV